MDPRPADDHGKLVVAKSGTVISLFSGALGLDLGLERAGFVVRVAIECNPHAAATIRANRPGLPLIADKLERVPTSQILDRAGLRVGEATVVTAGPSCQSFSTAGQRGSVADPRGVLFREFLRVVDEAKPEFFVMENVRGLLSAAIKHRSLAERGPGYPLLEPEERLGSAFGLVLQELKSLGYYVVFDLVNAADYGAPQRRERILFIGSRDGVPVQIPSATHSREPSGDLRTWVTLREGLQGVDNRKSAHAEFTSSEKNLLMRIPAGGNWRDLPTRLRRRALGAAFDSWGGRCGFYRRLSWNQPAPALTTVPDGRATMLCHPSKTRPLSIAEYARLQQFPDGWTFSGSTGQQYEQIGNAVPLALGSAAGKALEAALSRPPRVELLGLVVCPDGLARRLRARTCTVLNPPSMRKVKGLRKARSWTKQSRGSQHPILSHVTTESALRRLVPMASRKRMKAHRVTLSLHALYGSPSHGNKADPLDELVFIILSQMTTHHSFNRVYERLKGSVGKWEKLSGIRTARLKSLIKDAGLSGQKAPRIKAIVKKVKKDFGVASLAKLKAMSDRDAEDYLKTLPGVGTKTAKCVLMYSLKRPVLPVDTHVWRVATRLGLVDGRLGQARGQHVLEEAVPPTDRYSFHVNAIMHGRAACLALYPRCGTCPLRRNCPSGRSATTLLLAS